MWVWKEGIPNDNFFWQDIRKFLAHHQPPFFHDIVAGIVQVDPPCGEDPVEVSLNKMRVSNNLEDLQLRKHLSMVEDHITHASTDKEEALNDLLKMDLYPRNLSTKNSIWKMTAKNDRGSISIDILDCLVVLLTTPKTAQLLRFNDI
ncbi:hypothetical protein SUGI_1122310 [Cryptomeria japonica]|nr:hypothetical protein SUGI_1122310 [Cryptomeria japonica]